MTPLISRTWLRGGACAVAALLLGGCGSSDDVDIEARSAQPGEGHEDAATTTSTATLAADVPGVDATFAVESVPEGWTFVTEERPETVRGNPVIMLHYEGPLVEVSDVPNLSGAPVHLQATVGATYIPGLVAEGRDRDPLKLLAAGPGEWEHVASPSIQGRAGAEIRRVDGAGNQHVVVFTIGDWRLMAAGAEVETATLVEFLDAVVLR